MSEKLNDITSAGAVELEESKLDQVTGGAVDMWLKVGDVAAPQPDEESLKIKFTDL